jgi:hypothetical protein
MKFDLYWHTAYVPDKVSTSEIGPRVKERLPAVIFQDKGRYEQRKRSRETKEFDA